MSTRLFILDWLQSVELRRRVQAGLNKARRATRWRGRSSTDGASRDRSFEQQRYRASGLNLVTAAIVLEHGLSGTEQQCFERARQTVDETLFQYLSPLGWEHINPDRRLPLAQQRKDQRGKFQTVATTATGLTCFIFRFSETIPA